MSKFLHAADAIKATPTIDQREENLHQQASDSAVSDVVSEMQGQYGRGDLNFS